MPEENDPETLVIRRSEDDEDQDLPIDLDDIDLQALAEELYALLRQELRLEYERQGWRRIW